MIFPWPIIPSGTPAWLTTAPWNAKQDKGLVDGRSLDQCKKSTGYLILVK